MHEPLHDFLCATRKLVMSIKIASGLFRTYRVRASERLLLRANKKAVVTDTSASTPRESATDPTR